MIYGRIADNLVAGRNSWLVVNRTSSFALIFELPFDVWPSISATHASRIQRDKLVVDPYVL